MPNQGFGMEEETPTTLSDGNRNDERVSQPLSPYYSFWFGTEQTIDEASCIIKCLEWRRKPPTTLSDGNRNDERISLPPSLSITLQFLVRNGTEQTIDEASCTIHGTV
ncbi:hypothetical protein L6452_42624 [Arctium lappa]|uniref:Uncharacterized protein n=1 Tax=Arctium lappa TaxID=4217 RepID=A0ACB8XJF5_ARCLA|nr:hypothetical protein L6452_42624 [Arctium lappa]